MGAQHGGLPWSGPQGHWEFHHQDESRGGVADGEVSPASEHAVLPHVTEHPPGQQSAFSKCAGCHGDSEEGGCFLQPAAHFRRSSRLLSPLTTRKNEDKVTAVKLACASGWTQQHSAFDIFLDLLPPLLLCMDNIRDNDEGKFAGSVTTDAYSITEILFDFEIIVTIVILKNVLTFTRAFGRNLQGETLDVFFAANSLTAVLHSLNEVNDNIDVYHEFWFEEAVSLANVMEVPVKVPRLFLRKQRVADMDDIQTESYFKEYVTVPVIRGIMQEVEDMFSDTNLKALKCLSLVPAVMGQMKFNTTEEKLRRCLPQRPPQPRHASGRAALLEDQVEAPGQRGAPAHHHPRDPAAAGRQVLSQRELLPQGALHLTCAEAGRKQKRHSKRAAAGLSGQHARQAVEQESGHAQHQHARQTRPGRHGRQILQTLFR